MVNDNPLFHVEQDPFQTFLQSIPVRGARKPKVKRVITSRYDLRKLYYDARRVMFAKQYPQAFAQGEYYDNKLPDVLTTNGAQNYIQDVLNNLGHQCERVNTGGFMRKGKWCTSGSTKGSSDLHVVLQGGRAWKIEIKKGSGKLSGSQEKYRDKIIAAGGLHTVIYVGGLDLFWDEFNRIVKL